MSEDGGWVGGREGGATWVEEGNEGMQLVCNGRVESGVGVRDWVWVRLDVGRSLHSTVGRLGAGRLQ